MTSNVCACFPGTCRGGQIINGKTPTGAWCKAQLPKAPGAGEPNYGVKLGVMKQADHTDPLLAARGARYGAFADNARLSQDLKGRMRQAPKWDALAPDMKEALEMVAHKISRILCGDPSYDDSWVDIAGYATRVADRLKPSQT